MTNRHWRELVEIVGVVGIVASMILVASELRDSNRIAAAQAELLINQQLGALHAARATDPDVAKLIPKLESPESHLITATDASQIRGLAWQRVNILRSVQSAYSNDLISKKSRNAYVADIASSIEEWPGIHPHFVAIYQNMESIQGTAEFKPIADLVAKPTSQPGSE